MKETIHILCINETSIDQSSLLTEALSSFAKTIHLEHPKLICRVIQRRGKKKGWQWLLDELSSQEIEVRYVDQTRFIKRYEAIEMPKDGKEKDSLLKQQGVYLITGGLGGVGMHIARHLAKHYQAKLVLMGRSEVKDKQKAALSALEKLGATVLYLQGDVTQKEEVNRVIQAAKEQFGKLNGIIHSAGVIRDAAILNKTDEEIRDVLAPKIKGTLNLDDVMQSEALDFFMLFSSATSVFGNIGQSDYGYGNGFMDGLASWREGLRANHQRQGKTISINWPYWAEGGMKIDPENIKQLEQFGQTPLQTIDGLAAFGNALITEYTQLIVLAGEKEKIAKSMAETNIIIDESEVSKTPPTIVDKALLTEKVQTALTKIISELLKIKLQDIEMTHNLSEYGVDSIQFASLTRKINEFYGTTLTPAMFYGYNHIAAMSDYLVETYTEAMTKIHGKEMGILTEDSPILWHL